MQVLVKKRLASTCTCSSRVWQMSVSPRKTVWQMLASLGSLASPLKMVWRMSASLASAHDKVCRFMQKKTYFKCIKQSSLHSPNLTRTSHNINTKRAADASASTPASTRNICQTCTCKICA
jgi:hypothetical protein